MEKTHMQCKLLEVIWNVTRYAQLVLVCFGVKGLGEACHCLLTTRHVNASGLSAFHLNADTHRCCRIPCTTSFMRCSGAIHAEAKGVSKSAKLYKLLSEVRRDSVIKRCRELN